MTARIRLRDVEYTFPGRRLFSSVDLDLVAPMRVAVVGPSGTGKSTLLQIILGITKPSSGEVARLPQNLSSGVVPQHPLFIRGRTAIDNTALASAAQGMPWSQAHRAAANHLHRFGLEESAALPVELLSGGEQQRLGVARATLTDPNLVIADEPTANLDRFNAHLVARAISQQSSHRTLVVVATHDLELLTLFTHKVSIVDQVVGMEELESGQDG